MGGKILQESHLELLAITDIKKTIFVSFEEAAKIKVATYLEVVLVHYF